MQFEHRIEIARSFASGPGLPSIACRTGGENRRHINIRRYLALQNVPRLNKEATISPNIERKWDIWRLVGQCRATRPQVKGTH
jgi:hypothetical protein